MERISEKTAVTILCSMFGICVIVILVTASIHAYKKDCIVWKSSGDTLYSGQPATQAIIEMPEEKYIDQLIEFEELVYLHHIKYPDIVIAQAYLESGYLTSPLFVETNNCFGMKAVKNRPTTQFGDYNGYGIYSSLKDAVADYAIWQNGLPKSALESMEHYLNYLSSNYATDTNYVSKIYWIIDNQLHF